MEDGLKFDYKNAQPFVSKTEGHQDYICSNCGAIFYGKAENCSDCSGSMEGEDKYDNLNPKKAA